MATRSSTLVVRTRGVDAFLHGAVHGFTQIGETCGLCQHRKVSHRLWVPIAAGS